MCQAELARELTVLPPSRCSMGTSCIWPGGQLLATFFAARGVQAPPPSAVASGRWGAPVAAGSEARRQKLTHSGLAARKMMGVRFKVMRLMLSIRESREAWHMAAAKLSDEAFSAILEAHPGLRERFASIAMAVANSGENLKEADAIEERIVEEMRLLGREAMQGWAETQVKATEKEIRQQPSMHRQGKKNSAGIRNLAKSRF